MRPLNLRPLIWARAVAAVLVVAALVAALPSSAATSQHDALRSWQVELPGRIAGIAEHCGDDACVLFLLAAPSPQPSADALPPQGRDRGEKDLSLHRLVLDGDGARLTTVATLPGTARSKGMLGNSEQVSVQVGLDGGTVTRLSGATSGGIIIHLFTVDAPGREPVAVLQVGESVHVLSFGLSLGPSFAEVEALLDRPALEVDPGLHVRALAPGSPWLVAEEAGRLELIELEPSSASGRPSDSGSGRRRIEVVLPLEVGRQQRGLALSSPPVHVLAQEPLTLAIGPQAVGTVRLRTLVLQPLAPASPPEPNAPKPSAPKPSAEVPALERWSRLPEPEGVTRSEILRLGGLDLLLVETTRADGFGIFERKKLRLFELTADRTRSGHPPRAALLSYSRHWQALDWKVTDVTGDGVLDLVLLQPEGLSGEKLAVDLYRGKSDGTFADQKVRSLLPETRGQVRYGDDLDGDGVGDLLVLDVDSLALWRGRTPDRRGLLEESPDWIFRAARDDGSVPVPGEPGEPGEQGEHGRESLFVGAGRPELVLFVSDQETATRLEIVRLRRF